MRKCKVCCRADRRDIDRKLISGKSIRSIARETGLSHSSIGRHKSNHLRGPLPERLDQLEISNTANIDEFRIGDIAEQVRGLYSKSVSMMNSAEKKGNS